MNNIEVGALCAVLGIIISYLAFSRNKKRDDAAAGKQDGTILTEIGYIKSNTEEIKTEQRDQRKTNMEFVSRMTSVEASTKQAHKRIDRIEGSHEEER